MTDPTPTPEAHLSAAEGINTLLKPYRSEWKRREKLSRFMEQCIRSAKREDFFGLAELLGSRTAAAVAEEADLAGASAHLTALKAWSDAQISAYRTQFIADLTAAAQEADLPLTIDFPRFTSRKGVGGTIDFAGRKTTINDKVVKSVDPARILSQLKKLDRRLYGRPFNPQGFVDGLYATWAEMRKGSSQPIAIQDFYLQYVLGMQSKSFRKNLDKARFKGYPVDEFSVDLWRFYESPVSKTTSGHKLQLRAGRGDSLWLFDQTGELRKITTISFVKGA